MGFVISKANIIEDISKGTWALDNLSCKIKERIEKDEFFKSKNLIFSPLSVKNYLVTYYCKINSPFSTLFYNCTESIDFNTVILNKINKSGYVDKFSDLEEQAILNALDNIKKINNGYSIFIDDLSFIKIKSNDFKSASSPHLIGAIVLTDQINFNNNFELCRSIIHELAHNELFLINFYDRLIKVGQDNEFAYSPYQNQARPPIGRLHSLWAIFRMLQFGRMQNTSVDKELELFDKTINSLEGILTEFGNKLIYSIKHYAENDI